MPLAEVIQTALDRMQFIAKTETIIGEPIRAGEVTIIPVSKISVGFAAGGGGNEGKSGSGAGTGGGINVTPVAFIAITGDKVQVHPIENSESPMNALLSYAPELIKKAGKFIKREGGGKAGKSEKKKEESEDDAGE